MLICIRTKKKEKVTEVTEKVQTGKLQDITLHYVLSSYNYTFGVGIIILSFHVCREMHIVMLLDEEQCTQLELKPYAHVSMIV